MKKLLNVLGQFERGSITIIGFLVGALVSVLLMFWKSLNPTDNTLLLNINKNISALIVGLVIAVLFRQLGEIVEQNRTEKILGPFYQLRYDQALFSKIEEIIRDYLLVKETENKVFFDEAYQSLCGFVDNLSFLADGRLRIEPRDDLLFVIEQLDRCDKLVIASSFQNYEYWKSPDGEKYINKQVDFINNKKGRIVRIFMIKKTEREKYKEIIFDQAKRGILVRIGYTEDVDESLQEGYVIYDNTSVRIERSTSNPLLKDATLIIDNNEVRKYQRQYQNLFVHCKKLNEVFPKTFKELPVNIQTRLVTGELEEDILCD